MRKGTHPTYQARLNSRLGRLRKHMPPEEFARFMEADGALKWCPRCKQLLPAAEFHKSRSAWDGLFACCKACNSAAHADSHRKRLEEDPEYRPILVQRSAEWRAQAKADGRYREIVKKYQWKTRYGLTPESFRAMLAAQGHRCAICRKSLDLEKKHGIHVDHDHACCPSWKSCGRCIRGLLCSFCNQGLGRFRDDPGIMRRAARYIERHRAPQNAARPDYGQDSLWDDSGAA